jgi:hypothetical protein
VTISPFATELLARREQEDREAQLKQQELEERLARVHRRRQEDALRDRMPRDDSNTVPPTTSSQFASEPAEPSCVCAILPNVFTCSKYMLLYYELERARADMV